MRAIPIALVIAALAGAACGGKSSDRTKKMLRAFDDDVSQVASVSTDLDTARTQEELRGPDEDIDLASYLAPATEVSQLVNTIGGAPLPDADDDGANCRRDAVASIAALGNAMTEYMDHASKMKDTPSDKRISAFFEARVIWQKAEPNVEKAFCKIAEAWRECKALGDKLDVHMLGGIALFGKGC